MIYLPSSHTWRLFLLLFSKTRGLPTFFYPDTWGLSAISILALYLFWHKWSTYLLCILYHYFSFSFLKYEDYLPSITLFHEDNPCFDFGSLFMPIHVTTYLPCVLEDFFSFSFLKHKYYLPSFILMHEDYPTTTEDYLLSLFGSLFLLIRFSYLSSLHPWQFLLL